MCNKLDIQLNEIPHWNCCSASISFGEATVPGQTELTTFIINHIRQNETYKGQLSRRVLNARNLALAEQRLRGQNLVAGCPAYWLSTRETTEKLHEFDSLMAVTN